MGQICSLSPDDNGSCCLPLGVNRRVGSYGSRRPDGRDRPRPWAGEESVHAGYGRRGKQGRLHRAAHGSKISLALFEKKCLGGGALRAVWPKCPGLVDGLQRCSGEAWEEREDGVVVAAGKQRTSGDLTAAEVK